MKIALRQKELKSDRVSLYLDIYHSGHRSFEFLKLYLYSKPKSQAEKIHNKEMIQRANEIRSRKELEMIDNNYRLTNKRASKIGILKYFKQLTEERKKNIGNYGNWDSTYKILYSFLQGRDINLGDFDEKHLNGLRQYIANDYRTKANAKLSQNASSSYFNKVKAALRQAFNDKLIFDNIADRTKSISPEETHREFLTQSEILKLIETPCSYPLLKTAFLFSVYTGLRWSDIVNIQWNNITITGKNGSIKFTQQKTKGTENLPIPEFAVTLLEGLQKSSDERVFKGLKYSAANNIKISQWMLAAGISRNITFHCARHTYATLLLTKNIDIYTVSKLLGHRELKTTQIYAKVIDQRKIDAVTIFDQIK